MWIFYKGKYSEKTFQSMHRRTYYSLLSIRDISPRDIQVNALLTSEHMMKWLELNHFFFSSSFYFCLVLLSVIRKDTIYVSFKLSYSALTVSEYFTGANILRKEDVGPTSQIFMELQCDLMRICMYLRKMVLQNLHFLTFAIDTETYNTDVFTASKHTILTYWQHLKHKSYLRMNYFTDLQMNPYEYSVVIPMALFSSAFFSL